MRLMADAAGAQFLHSLEPILIRRTFGAPAGFPEFACEPGDVFMTKSGDAVSDGWLRTFVCVLGGMPGGLHGMSLMGCGHTMLMFGKFL